MTTSDDLVDDSGLDDSVLDEKAAAVAAYARAFHALGAAPAFVGTVRLVVARQPDELKAVLSVGRLSRAQGLSGDRWNPLKDPERKNQLTLMNARVVEAISGRGLVPDSGDNFLVDLDLAEDTLPVGTRLRVGTALIEVTDEPHNGCGKFSKRFGQDALRFVNGKERRPLRLRGIHARVLEDGEVRPGDSVTVLDDVGGR